MAINEKLSCVRQLLDQSSMQVSIYLNICDILDDVSKEMYAIREDQKRIIASNRSLENRYSEMMSLLKDIRRSQLGF